MPAQYSLTIQCTHADTENYTVENTEETATKAEIESANVLPNKEEGPKQ